MYFCIDCHNCYFFTVSVEDIVNANHFKSSQESSQQILHRSTLPTALKEVYGSCSEPPNLNEFTKYRDDSKEGLKFYTDSDYFVRLWVEETTKQTEKRRRKVGCESPLVTYCILCSLIVWVLNMHSVTLSHMCKYRI